MPLFTYERDIPDAPNNPSADQPDMKINTNSIDSLIGVDHYSFNQNLGGLHKQSVYQERTPIPSTIPTTAVDQGAVYTKESNGTTNLFFRAESNGQEIQLTNAQSIGSPLIGALASFPAFGQAPGAIVATYSYNIASITKVATGRYTIVFTNNLPSANYIVTINCVDDTGNLDKDSHFTKVVNGTQASSGFSLETNRANNHSFDDPIAIMISCIGG